MGNEIILATLAYLIFVLVNTLLQIYVKRGSLLLRLIVLTFIYSVYIGRIYEQAL